MNIAPEPGDFQRLVRVATLAAWPNTYHKLCVAIGKLFATGLATSADVPEAERLLAGFLWTRADEPLQRRIRETAASFSGALARGSSFRTDERERQLRRKTTEARAGDVKDSQADITKAKTLLGYQPTVSLDEGLRRTLEWCRAESAAATRR